MTFDRLLVLLYILAVLFLPFPADLLLVDLRFLRESRDRQGQHDC